MSRRRGHGAPVRLAVLCGVAIPMTACAGVTAGGATARPTPSAAVTASPTPPPPTPPPCTNLQAIASWSVEQRAAQLVVVPAQETDVAAVSPSVAAGAGGVILFGSAAPQDLGTQLAALDAGAPAGVDPLVMSDEEGGGVQRMANLAGSLPWPATMAATMTPSQVQQAVAAVARRMLASGVNMDLAPVLDLAAGPGPDAQHTDGPRSFGLSPSVATQYGLAFARGLQSGGVIPVVKHFPGEGAASANTDDAPATTPPLSELEKNDLLPFEAAIRAGLPAVMVGNASVPGLTGTPASLSAAAITGLLRGQLGFHGLVITDALNAKAISALGISVPRAAVEAVAAGADMVLYNSSNPNLTFTQTVQALVAAVSGGTITPSQLDEAVDQVLTLKDVDLCATPSP